MEQKVKIVFFDMEGTLFLGKAYRPDGSLSPSLYTVIEEMLGEDVKQKAHQLFKKMMRGEFASYEDAVDAVSRLYQSAGLTRDLFDRAVSSMEYVPGVHETVQKLHHHGYRTAIISGGFHDLAQRAVRDMGIHHAVTSCKYFWNEDGTLSRWETAETGFEGKVASCRQIMQSEGVLPEDCMFVGDGDNDVHIAQAVGTSIAFNGHPELQKVCTYAVNQPKGEEDFRVILDYLLPHDYAGYTGRASAARIPSV